MPLSPNQRLGAYEVVCPLGAGGMGEVYRARDTRLSRDVAIKVLPPEVTGEPGRLERFDREARAIAALNHPHIVTIYSTEEADGIRFLTMELVDGCTLSDLIISTGMAIPRFLDIAIPLADALAAAHQKQITHRDLKPGNVMLSNDGRVKVLDFGLARVGGGTIGEETMATRAPITHQGMIVGTMPYMSPEQVEGRVLDARSDLFSLGVIFYELLSGERPFKGSSSPALMSAILRDTPPAIGERRSDIPESLQRLVDRLLEKRPEDRWQTARDVFNELRHVRKLTEPGSGRSSSTARPAQPQNLSIAVLPFSSRNNEADIDDLSSGLTDDIAASLAKFSLLSVVAAQSTRAYKDSPLDVRQISERVGARYVLGGNIRKSSRIIRVTAQLIDATSGAQLWSESYDRDATAMDLFAIQDDLTDHIAATIGDQSGVLARSMVKSVRAELPASEQTTRELILRTWGLRQNPESHEHAAIRSAIEARLTVEPQNADLWAELSHLYLDEHILAINEQPDSLGRAMVAARRAVEIDPSHQKGWGELAGTCFFAKDGPGLFDAADRAIRLNPRNAYTLAWMGNLYTHAGEYERGSKLSERAMAINPRHAGWLHFGVFNRHFASGDFAEALRVARRVNMPQLNWNYFAIATAAAHLGLTDEARQAAARMIMITPQLANPATLRDFTERWYWRPEMVDSLLDGVAQAIALEQPGAAPTPQLRSAAKPPSSSSGSARSGSSSTTVMVLPFVPRSSDEESKSLADALTDDLTTGLSRFGYLKVTSRSAAERRTSSAPARYSIEGHVRKAGSTIRIGITLVDTETATNLWTNTYDRDISSGAFAIQDDVSSAAVATIGDQTGVLVRAIAGAMADRPYEELTVAELVIRYHLYTEAFNPQVHAQLRSAFERALEREPRHAEGWACLSLLYEQEHAFKFNPLPDPLERQQQAAKRGAEADPRSQTVWVALTSVHSFGRDREAMKSAAERAFAINPLNADMVALAGVFLSGSGEHERASTLARHSMKLKPQHPPWYYFPIFNAYYAAGDYEAALREHSKIGMVSHPLVPLFGAAVAGHLGRASEAKTAFTALRRIDPALGQPEAARAAWARWIWSEEWLDSLVDGFKKAKALEARSDDRSDARSAAVPQSRTGDSASGTTVAVLQFVPRSSDDESKALADALTDDITTGLSRFGYLKVASRSAAERRTSSPPARYSIEGHVRKAGSTVRIGITLVDTETATNLWTNTYDRDISIGAFAVQDEVSSAAVATIGDQTGMLVRAMGGSIVGRPADQLSASELAIRYHIYTESFHPDEHARLRDALERRLEEEPRVAEAWACLALLYQQEHAFGLNPRPDPLGRQRRAAERALEIDPTSQQAWVATVGVHCFDRDPTALTAAADRAVRINPLNADLIALTAIYLSVAGESEKAVALVRQAIARKPNYPGWYHFPMFNAHARRAEWEAALAEIKAVNIPRMPINHLDGAAAAGHLGQKDVAVASLAALRLIDPALATADAGRRVWEKWIWNEATVDVLVDGLTKAIALEARQAEPSTPSPSSSSSRDASIAVLPFKDLSEKKDQDWFCDGIAEEIISALAGLPGLRVAARASAFSFRGKADDLEVIAERLNVSTVLEGSVRRAGDRVRITTQLSDARQGKVLWSERFDRELKDIFEVQDEIARAIADRLRISISSGSRLVQQATTNIEAYQLLLQGRTLVTRRGRALLDAIPLFERAIALDPNLAEAHALLGDAQRLLAVYGVLPPIESMSRARASTERALAIDPAQPEALATMSIIAGNYEWNVEELRVRADRALAVDPCHVRCHAERAIWIALSDVAREAWTDEVLHHIGRARTLDPLNAWVMAVEAAIFIVMGRIEEAIAGTLKAIELDGSNFTARWFHVWALSEAGRDGEAITAAETALAMSGRNPQLLSNLSTIHAQRGELEKVEAIRVELSDRAATSYIGSAARAVVAAGAGQWEEARTLLAAAIAERDPYLAFWKLYAWRPVWTDRACAELLLSTRFFRNADGSLKPGHPPLPPAQ